TSSFRGSCPRSNMDRLRAARELLRRIAMLLSGEQPLTEVLHELCLLLAETFEASVRIGYTVENGEPRTYEHGEQHPEAPSTHVAVAFSGIILGDLSGCSQRPLDADH